MPKTRNAIDVYKFKGVGELLNTIFPNNIKDTIVKNNPITKLSCVNLFNMWVA